MSILEKFTVIDLIKTRSASVATITGNVLKFNNQTAAELHFAQPEGQAVRHPRLQGGCAERSAVLQAGG